MKNDELLHKWLNNTISAEELAVFKTREEYEDLLKIKSSTDEIVMDAHDPEATLKHILSRSKIKQEVGNSKFGIIRMLSLGIAASFLLFAAITFWPGQNNSVSYEMAFNEQLKENLPDQSEFVLNADSKLSYNSKKWSTERKLHLEGEAHFKVQKGAKFTVITSQGEVEVLGTEFNVKSRDGTLEVTCFEGRVEVRAINEVKKIITADQIIRIDKDGKVMEWEGPLSNSDSWTSGITKLRNVTLAQVIRELERQFDIEIDASGIDQSVILTCNFQQNDLNNALLTTMTAVSISYQIKGNKKVVLSR